MKKLVTLAMAMAAVSAMAVESRNVVGYMNQTMDDDRSFVAAPFTTVGMNTIDLQDIKIEGDGVGFGTESFAIWSGLPTMSADADFIYWDPSMGGADTFYWGDVGGAKVDYTLAQGQGVVIACGTGFTVKYAGQVPTEPVSFTTVDGNNFSGNSFPAAISIQDITIEGDGVGFGMESFTVWSGLPTLKEGVEFYYWDPSMGGVDTFYWGDINGVKIDYTIAPAQGFVINCAADYTVMVAVPYSL